MHLPRFIAAVALALGLAGVPLLGAAAQEADLVAPECPVPAGERLDLAAMALAGTDVPPEYLLTSEQYIAPDVLAELYLGGAIPETELLETGLQWFYESRYATPDRLGQIRSYVEEYETPEGAEAGFALLEDETPFIAEGAQLEDLAGPGIGEEPSEITVGAYPSGDATLQSVDVTFRIGNIIAGAAVETTGPTPPDQALAEELAARLAERIEMVLACEYPEGVDPTLPGLLLPIEEAGLSVQEGYIGELEALGTVGQETEAFGQLTSAYVQTVARGLDPEQALPFLTLALSEFATAEGALAVLAEADALVPPFPGLEPVGTVRVPGAEAAVAYRFTSPLPGQVPSAEADSYRILMLVGNLLATVDVQGAASAEAAEEIALDLAAQQAACLAEAGPCETVTLPEALTAPAEATPQAGEVL